MTANQPIDYARAESADVVRRKFRRRVVMFVIAMVVLVVIGFGWIDSYAKLGWTSNPCRAISIGSDNGWVSVWGPERQEGFTQEQGISSREVGNDEVGWFWQNDLEGFPKWRVAIRYRTLFTLAMIPWLITLIRLIRIWKKKKVLRAEC